MKIDLRGNDAERAFKIVADIGESFASLLKSAVDTTTSLGRLLEAKVDQVRATTEALHARTLLNEARIAALQKQAGGLPVGKGKKPQIAESSNGLFNGIRGIERVDLTQSGHEIVEASEQHV